MAVLPILPFSASASAALAIPALAYLNARLAISYDAGLLGAVTNGLLSARWRESRDRLNMFYVLESRAAASSTANHAFLLYGDGSWTYKEAHTMALRYGNWLRTSHGVKPGDVVAMDFMNCDDFVWMWFGLWSIGAKPAFINYNLVSAPLLHSIRTSTATLVLVDPDVQAAFTDAVRAELARDTFGAQGSVEMVLFDDAKRREARASAAVRSPDSDRGGQRLPNMAMLIYTSGTTGLPKPAVVSWSKSNVGGIFMSHWLPMTSKDIVYTCMPLYHSSAAILALLACLSAGATLALGHRFNRRNVFADCRKYNATCLQYVGETCRYLLSLPQSADDKSHKLRVAYGNGMRPDVWNRFKDRFGIQTVAEFYALTEGPSGMWNKSSNDFSAGAVGRNGTLARLATQSQIAVIKLDFATNSPARNRRTGFCERVGENEPGELVYMLDEKDIEGRFQGYYGNDNASNSKILRNVFKKGDAWFSTGDVLRVDGGQRWYFVDRIGDTFRWKSENVSTAEVAEVLGKTEGVLEANVYGVSVPGHDGRAGCAAVVLDGIEKAGAEAERMALARLAGRALESLPRYAVPVFVRLGKAMAQTGTMKQQKTGLRDEGVDPEKVACDRLFWLKPGGREYVPFGRREWDGLVGGEVKL